MFISDVGGGAAEESGIALHRALGGIGTARPRQPVPLGIEPAFCTVTRPDDWHDTLTDDLNDLT